MLNTHRYKCAPAHGFTLIELMIVVAIVALLASIALPSYQNHMEKARRSDGQNALLDTAQRLERCYTQYGAYDDTANCTIADDISGGNTRTSPEENYEISATSLNASTFTLQAAPQGGQSDDDCGNLTLTHTGVKGKSGSGTRCW